MFYDTKYAQNQYETTLSESRRGIALTEQELNQNLDLSRKLTGRKELYRNLLKEAKEHQKQIVAFDDLTGILEDEVSVPVYFPKVDRSNLPASRYGKLYRISKPVVGVFGTSSRQGKFTLQLILRRSLLRKGYRIGQIGTEPSALLFGMDDVAV